MATKKPKAEATKVQKVSKLKLPKSRTLRIIGVFVVLYFIGVAIGLYLHDRQPKPAPLPVTSQSGYVLLNGRRFDVQVASTKDERAHGLSGTQSLSANQGMLFVFNPSELACFWMKDMRYNLDILWFDSHNKLIYLQQNLSPATYPHTYCPPSATSRVLEIKAGSAKQLNVKVGDTLK